jgi:hypothetical protein
MTAVEFANLVKNPRRRVDGIWWAAVCPAHDDHRASLSFRDGDERLIPKCHAGCTREQIAAAVGLSVADFFRDAPDRRTPPHGRIVATYDYDDETGALLYQAVRLDPKAFYQRMPHPTTDEAWLNGTSAGWYVDGGHSAWKRVGADRTTPVLGALWSDGAIRRVLYRLPALLILKPKVLFVVEGEKDADALWALGLGATTSVAGAGKWKPHAAEYAAQVRTIGSPLVVLIPDNDDAGRQHMADVKASLEALGIATRQLDLPVPRKGDASDWIAGITASTNPETGAPTWPIPQPVPIELLPPVASFDVATLMPESFAPWVRDVAERIQCPADYVGVTVMVTAGSVIGRQCVVRPKRYDDWEVVPNLWGLVIGPPGIMKSPAIKEGTRPLGRLIAAEMERYKVAMRDARFIRMKCDAQDDRLKKALKEALERANGDEQAPDVLRVRDQLREPREPLPTERIYRTNDATVEKVAVLLGDNPNGFLIERDEIAGLIKTMDREGHQNDRVFYEECWNGTGSYRVDRIERGSLHVEAACLSLLGGIQPAPLESYLREWERRGLDDGFIQRFQLMVYPDVTPFRRVDRWPESRARETAVEAFRLIDQLDLRHLQARSEAGVLPWLNFDEAGQAAFDSWYDAWQHRLRSDAWPSVLRQHFAKYPSLVPALALIDHLVAGGTGPIPASCVARALGRAAYLASHARRVYATLTERTRGATALLARRLLDSVEPVPDPVTLRWIYRHHWTGLANRADVEPAVTRLLALGWLREVEIPPASTGGRPTRGFAINPAIRAEGFGTAGTECPPEPSTGAEGSDPGGTGSPVWFPGNMDGMEWKQDTREGENLTPPSIQNLETVPETECHRCHYPLASCACSVEFIDDARE